MSIMDAVDIGTVQVASHFNDSLYNHIRNGSLAVGRGVGAEMWNGLGITVASGLTVSTFVTLFLVPGNI